MSKASNYNDAMDAKRVHYAQENEQQKEPVICIIPADEKIVLGEDQEIEDLCQAELATYIEQMIDFMNIDKSAPKKELLGIINDACSLYNARARMNIFQIRTGSEPRVTVPVSDLEDRARLFAPDERETPKQTLPVRAGKEQMIEVVIRIKQMAKLKAERKAIASATGFSESFIAKVLNGTKYPEVKI